MYTVYDFINNDIPSKKMRFGWRAHMERRPFGAVIILSYMMLNFDWNSLKFLNNEVMDMFLLSQSYASMKARQLAARQKFGRLWFEAMSIADLKSTVESAGLKIDIDRLLEEKIRRKSAILVEKIKNRPQKAIRTVRKTRNKTASLPKH